MKRGVLCIAAALVLCTATLSAQISATKLSTAGLFGTDIDDFMDVNYYSGVAPEHLFGFVGFGMDEAAGDYFGEARNINPDNPADPNNREGNLTLGLAHQFSKLYLGAFFNGRIANFPAPVRTPDGTDQIQNTATGDAFDFAVLFGFGKIGLKYSLSYATSNLKATGTPLGLLEAPVGLYDNMVNKLLLGLALGEDTKILPRFALGVASTFLKENPGYTDYNNVYSNAILLNAGVGIEFAQNGILQHSVDVDLETRWTIFPVEKGSDTVGNTTTKYEWHGEADNSIAILPAYTLTVSPTDNIDVKAQVGLPISMRFARTATSSKTIGDTTTSRDIEYYSENTIEVAPTLALGLQYRPRENIALNTGLEIGLPTFLWSVNSSPDYTSTDSVKNRDTNASYSYMNSAFAVKWSTGLSWTIAKVVTLDFNWNILNNILDGFANHRYNDGANNDFWQIVGDVVKPDFAFMLSVKF